MTQEPAGDTTVAAWRWPVLAGAVTFLCELLLFWPLIKAYFPTNDEIALEAVSTPTGGAVHPTLWLTEGFHGYFASYPEWGTINSDLIRPVANALFWAYYEAFGAHWGIQLAIGYLIHAIVVSLVAYVALCVCKLRPFYALMAVLVAALNPAMWALYPSPRSISNMAQFPIFQTEILCALLMLLALLAFVYRRFGVFALLATTAVMLKETALTVPLSALLLIHYWRDASYPKHLRNLVFLLTPLITWGVLKLWVFQHGFLSAVLLSDRPNAWLIQPLRNALLWPTGLYVGPLASTRQLLSAHEWAGVATHAAESLLNLLWWIVLLLAGLLAYKEVARPGLQARPDPWVAALCFAGGNLALVLILQSSQLRFGYFWYAVGPAALFGASSKWRAGAVLATLMSVGLAVPQAMTMAHALSNESLNYYAEVKESARQMAALLHGLPGSVKKVYIVDDLFVKPVAPAYLARFAGFRGDVILINSLDPVPACHPAWQPKERYRLHTTGVATVLEYQATPTCLQWLWNSAPVTSPTSATEVPRGTWLTYRFPEFRTIADSSVSGGKRFDVGQRWSVRATDPQCAQAGACVWIGFDAAARRYVPLLDH